MVFDGVEDSGARGSSSSASDTEWSSLDEDDVATGGERTAVALRFGDVVLDASELYSPGPQYATQGVVDAYRWFNSEMHFKSKRANVLLRLLQHNSVEVRTEYFAAA